MLGSFLIFEKFLQLFSSSPSRDGRGSQHSHISPSQRLALGGGKLFWWHANVKLSQSTTACTHTELFFQEQGPPPQRRGLRGVSASYSSTMKLHKAAGYALAALAFTALCLTAMGSKMSEAELFEILGLPRGATAADVKKAYRELALK
jgi:hypothetical protein